MTPDETRAHVVARLATAASEEGVRILYAAESGSRAWGFPSPDSDFDVRFLYAHERNWYVSLAEARDVIERPLDEAHVDLAGWDIRKALRLLLRSNPALYEWLVSPIVYVDSPLRAELKALFEAHASPRALAHHYWSIARGQWRSEIEGKAQVRLKNQRWLLVTSAWHMPRAMGCFRRVGFAVEAWPVDHRTPRPLDMTRVYNSIPEGLCRIGFVVREYVGLAVYYLTGRTETLLPGP